MAASIGQNQTKSFVSEETILVIGLTKYLAHRDQCLASDRGRRSPGREKLLIPSVDGMALVRKSFARGDINHRMKATESDKR